MCGLRCRGVDHRSGTTALDLFSRCKQSVFLPVEGRLVAKAAGFSETSGDELAVKLSVSEEDCLDWRLLERAAFLPGIEKAPQPFRRGLIEKIKNIGYEVTDLAIVRLGCLPR